MSFPAAGAAQDFTYTASLVGLAPGFHTLYTRVLEQRPAEVNPLGPLGPLGSNADAGQAAYLPARKAWSIAHVRPVYAGPVGTGLDNLTYLEYFFDTDPGYRLGHGVALSAPAPGVDQSYVADLSGLTPGFHTMYTRVKNASGAWSINSVRPIYVGPTNGAGGAAPDQQHRPGGGLDSLCHSLDVGGVRRGGLGASGQALGDLGLQPGGVGGQDQADRPAGGAVAGGDGLGGGGGHGVGGVGRLHPD